jgi:hypothetical protein
MGVISIFSLNGVNSELSIESIKSIFSTLIAPENISRINMFSDLIGFPQIINNALIGCQTKRKIPDGQSDDS